jgi:hypothetical protein
MNVVNRPKGEEELLEEAIVEGMVGLWDPKHMEWGPGLYPTPSDWDPWQILWENGAHPFMDGPEWFN